jgi:hypothetical protein
MSFIGTSVNKVLNVFGRELRKVKRRKKGVPSFYDDYDLNIGYDLEKEANEGIAIVRKNTMLPYVNLLTLYEQVIYCEENGIEGDFVECGVWKGGATGLMAYTNLKKGKKRRDIHLFDAFTEICAPDAEVDGERAVEEIKTALGTKAKVSGELEAMTGLYDRFGGPGSLEDNRKLLEQDIKYPAEKIHYHVGWFQDTMPEASKQINRIAILRLDGDWYASTKICLDYLYDKVVDGGFIIIDDYGAYDGCKKAVDEFLANRNIRVFINYSSESCRYWIKGQHIPSRAN